MNNYKNNNNYEDEENKDDDERFIENQILHGKQISM